MGQCGDATSLWVYACSVDWRVDQNPDPARSPDGGRRDSRSHSERRALDISRIVSGKLSLEIQSVHLASIVEAAIESVEHAAIKKGLRIERDLDATIEPTAADPGRLQQVLGNLLSKALKFTSDGGTVRVTLRRKGADAEIVVADSGTGIATEFLPHVFVRFQQADASRARRFGGLGLGLSIVKNLVQLHGGSVVAESDGHGRGSTFTVTCQQPRHRPGAKTPFGQLRRGTPSHNWHR